MDKQEEHKRRQRSTLNDEHEVPASPQKRIKMASGCVAKYPNTTTYWVLENAELPPSGYFSPASSMSSMISGNKRQRNSSGGRSTQISAICGKMVAEGICMDDTDGLSESGRKLCQQLFEGNRPPASYPTYQEKHRRQIRRRSAKASEAKIQRDILPTVIPSIENLDLIKPERYNNIELSVFTDDINAEWARASTMGSTRPKPNYVAGLKYDAFDAVLWDALINYANIETPVLLSKEMCFPLVIGEVKQGFDAMQTAFLRAVHAGAIAVKSQISLHQAAYGPQHAKTVDLLGQPLVFSIYLNHDEIHILAHYALSHDGKLGYRYQKLQIVSLSKNNGRDENVPNNFVENVYEKCIPTHLARLRVEAKHLCERAKIEKEMEAQKVALEERSSGTTGLSFNASQMGVEHDTSTTTDIEDSRGGGDGVLKKPRLPLATEAVDELAQIRKMMQEHQARSEAREKELIQQINHLIGKDK